MNNTIWFWPRAFLLLFALLYLNIGMAEDSNNDSNSGGNVVQQAIELLQEVSMLLSSASPVQSVEASQSTTSTSPLATTPLAVQRLRTIFAPYPRTSVSPASAYQRAQRPKTTSYKLYYAIKETWTHEFFCLSEKNQSKGLSRSDKIQLQNCGLGCKKYVSRQRQTIHCLKKS